MTTCSPPSCSAANYKEGTQTVTFGEATEVATEGNGSDLDCIPAPRKTSTHCVLVFLFRCERGLEQGGGAQRRKQSHSAALLSPRFPTHRNVYREADCPLSFLFYMAVSLELQLRIRGLEQQRRRPQPAAETGRSCWGSVLIFQSPAKGLQNNQQTQPVRP